MIIVVLSDASNKLQNAHAGVFKNLNQRDCAEHVNTYVVPFSAISPIRFIYFYRCIDLIGIN